MVALLGLTAHDLRVGWFPCRHSLLLQPGRQVQIGELPCKAANASAWVSLGSRGKESARPTLQVRVEIM
eukprot:SAG25_NODE_55_length_18625_cov_548.233726_3_plen_69_part_00